MKKKLFLMAACMASALSAVAQQVGDYVYTGNGRFRVIGENLIANGDFSAGMDEWATDSGEPIGSDCYSIENDGADGSPCLTVTQKFDGAGTRSTLMRTVSVYANVVYYISYNVKANEEVTTTVSSADKKNYQNIFFNTDGSLTPWEGIARSKTYDYDWTRIAYDYSPKEKGFLVLHFYGPYVGTCFDDFSVVECMRVVDDREVNRVLTLLNSYRENPLFAEGHEMLDEAIALLNATLQETDDWATWNELLDAVENQLVKDFLDANSIVVTNHLKCPGFDAATPNKNEQTNIGGWTAEGGRWMIRAAEDPFTTVYVDRSIGGKYTLSEGRVYQTLENMPAGNYMFTMKANARRYMNKNDEVWDGYEIRGLQVYMNDDAVECFPIDTLTMTPYTVFSHISEGQTLTLGFYMPADVANKVAIDDSELRLIGWTQEQVDEFFLGREFAESKALLKTAIDQASELLSSNDYLYEKASLEAALSAAQSVCSNASTIEDVRAETEILNAAIANYKRSNSVYTALMSNIAKAESLLANEDNTEQRDELLAILSAAKEFVGTLTADGRTAETDQSTLQHKNDLQSAILVFTVANMNDDEKYPFVLWAAAEDASYNPNLSEDPVATSSGAELYVESGTFGGQSLNGRFAMMKDNCNISVNSNGLQVNPSGKNVTSIAILDLEEGDQVTIDWTMANPKHVVYIASANASYTNAEGQKVTLTETGKQDANLLDNSSNDDGLNGLVRNVFTMTASGTLDLYQGSSNSALRIGYVGIRKHDASGITQTKNTNATSSEAVYDLSGRKVSGTRLNGLRSGMYICQGKKLFVK